MQQALTLALGGVGFVSPNPLVGCIIVDHGTVVGRGYHQRFGGPHAEVHALQEAGAQARGAVLYVTLEPCCHTGKTPPCVDAIIQAGIARVVMAIGDPNPRVSGGGVARLQAAGIAVTSGVGAVVARQQNEAFVKYMTTQRPFITLKAAMTLDGKIATHTGASQWITGPEARLEGHRLRHASDAIVVGIGTVLQDDPQLTTRLLEQRGVNALRIIVDSTLRLPLQAQVATVTETCRTLVATTTRAPEARRQALQARGIEVLCCATSAAGRVDLEHLCVQLGERMLTSVMLEGGGSLNAAFLQHGLVDKVMFFLAPKIIGGDGVNAIAACGVESMDEVLQIRDMRLRHVGPDVLLEGYLR